MVMYYTSTDLYIQDKCLIYDKGKWVVILRVLSWSYNIVHSMILSRTVKLFIENLWNRLFSLLIPTIIVNIFISMQVPYIQIWKLLLRIEHRYFPFLHKKFNFVYFMPFFKWQMEENCIKKSYQKINEEHK